MILRDYQSFSAANAIRSLTAMHHVPSRKKNTTIAPRRPRPVNKVDWEEDVEEHENPDWLVGSN